MAEVECPYCGYEQDLCHDDGRGYAEGVKHQDWCGKCGKSFVYETTISFNYEAYPADCLNDDKHDWKPTHTYPVEFTMMQCSMCGEERKPTEEEFNNIKSST